MIFAQSAFVFLGLLFRAIDLNASSHDEEIRLDCGVNAIFLLHRLEGRSLTLDQLLSVLPTRHPDGYSMTELAAVSKSLGIPLDGREFIKGDMSLVRPAIAFLADAKGGHFILLRPVGSTGTMVQVINPPSYPWITDYDKLFSSKSWTGHILVPRDPWTVRYFRYIDEGLSAVVVTATLMVALSVWRYRMRIRSRLPSA